MVLALRRMWVVGVGGVGNFWQCLILKSCFCFCFSGFLDRLRGSCRMSPQNVAVFSFFSAVSLLTFLFIILSFLLRCHAGYSVAMATTTWSFQKRITSTFLAILLGFFQVFFFHFYLSPSWLLSIFFLIIKKDFPRLIFWNFETPFFVRGNFVFYHFFFF